MRVGVLATFSAAFLLCASCAHAAPLVDCSKTGNLDVIKAACADPGIFKLDNEVAAAFDHAIAAAADPLTATLLVGENKRRQQLLESISQDASAQSLIEPVLSFLRQSLSRDAKLLKAIAQPQPNDGVAGQWVNAFGTLTVTPVGTDRYHLAIERSRVENRFDEASGETLNKIVSCNISVDLKNSSDGWFSAGTQKKGDAPTKLTRQGISLRLFVGEAERTQGDGSCDVHDAATGSYFRVGSVSDRLVIATARKPEPPSFTCNGNAGPIEIEICSDPELAKLDRALAKAYQHALARLDPEMAALFKSDEKAWIKGRADDYGFNLRPLFYKQDTTSDNFGNARQALVSETAERVRVLDLIEGRRESFVGDWTSAAGSFVHIGRDSDGKFALVGEIWGNDRKPTFCAYRVQPTVSGGILSARAVKDAQENGDGDIAPGVWSDGRTLVIAADLAKTAADGRPVDDGSAHHYCRRNQQPTDRLFPIRGDDKKRFEGVERDLQELEDL